MRLLALCDSPTAQTGFARVSQNLLTRWLKANGGIFDQIDIWGINYRGEKHNLPFWIYQGGFGWDWISAENLGRMVSLLSGKPIGEPKRPSYTHLWMMQDTFSLMGFNFPAAVKKVCDVCKIRSVYYMPVDAPLEPEWMAIAQHVDAVVAYTEYGKAEALKALPRTFNPASIQVIPHGCDTGVYHPKEERAAIRKRLFRPSEGQAEFLADADFLIVNVNANQRRKDIPRTMRIVRELNIKAAQYNQGLATLQTAPTPPPAFKLVLHMPKVSPDGIDLGKVGTQLGLVENVHWMSSDNFFKGGAALLDQKHVADLYNSADLMLTTSLGEGWGFCLTEAIACGCAIAVPAHTACVEIMERLVHSNTAVIPLDVEEFGVVNAHDNSRFRDSVDVKYAVDAIYRYATRGEPGKSHGQPLTDDLKEWLSWDRIAREWEKIFLGQSTIEKKPDIAIL